jgi:hypothetical protein
MRQFLLAVVLVLAPVAAFFGGRAYLGPAPVDPAVQADAPSLGDLAPMQAIVSDVQAITATGDLAKAETRITDLETAWDEAEADMRPKNPPAWGTVDDAIDAALKALRAATPSPEDATRTLAALQVAMADPTAGGNGAGGVQFVHGIAVTDVTGHPLPCEAMLTDLAAAIGTATPPQAVLDLQAKAMERCNADDDRTSGQFSAEALALLKA